jgi:iron complex outermembrane receptor protein
MSVTTYLIKIPGLVRPDTYRNRLMSVFAGTFIAVVPVVAAVAEENNEQTFQEFLFL